MSDLKLYVWRGDNVLKDYSSGMVVVVAPSAEEAWAKLRRDDMRAFYKLKLNASGVESEWEVKEAEKDQAEWEPDWVAPQPEEFTLDALPTLVRWGGG